MEIDGLILICVLGVILATVLCVFTVIITKLNRMNKRINQDVYEIKSCLMDVRNAMPPSSSENTLRRPARKHSPTNSSPRKYSSPSISEPPSVMTEIRTVDRNGEITEVRSRKATNSELSQRGRQNGTRQEHSPKRKIEYTVEDHLRREEQQKQLNLKKKRQSVLPQRNQSSSDSQPSVNSSQDRQQLREQFKKPTDTYNPRIGNSPTASPPKFTRKGSVENFLQKIESEEDDEDEEDEEEEDVSFKHKRDRSNSLKPIGMTDRSNDMQHDFDSKPIKEASPVEQNISYEHPYLENLKSKLTQEQIHSIIDKRNSVPEHISIAIPKALRLPPPMQDKIYHESPPATPQGQKFSDNDINLTKSKDSGKSSKLEYLNDEMSLIDEDLSVMDEDISILNDDDMSSLSSMSTVLKFQDSIFSEHGDLFKNTKKKINRSNVTSIVVSDRPDSVFSDAEHANELRKLPHPLRKEVFKKGVDEIIRKGKVRPTVDSFATSSELTWDD